MRAGLLARAILAAIVAAGIGSVAAGAASATTVVADATSWSQYQGDAQHTGSATEAPAPPFRLAWSRPTGIGDETHFAGIPAPVIAGEDAVVVDREDVSAVSLSSGAVDWSIPRQLGPSAPAAVVPGDRTTILYVEGGGDRSSSASSTPSASSVAPTSTASPDAATSTADRSTLVAIDAGNRRVLWRSPLPGMSVGGPTIDGSTVFVGTDDGSVTAVALGSGHQDWTVDLGDGVNTPVAVSGGIVYVAADQGTGQPPAIIALREADHSPLWRFEVGAGASIGAPVVADGTVFAAVSDGSLRAIDAATGVARWAAKLNTVSGGGAPAVSTDAVVVVDVRGEVYRFASSTGERLWDFAMNAPVYASPVIAGPSVVVGDATGDVSAIDLQTGERIWRENVGDGLPLGFALTPDLILAARTGPTAGVVGLAAEPNGVLVHEKSPTIVAPAQLGLAWAIAAIPLVLILVGAGRFLDRRLGPPVFEGDEDALEPEDEPA